MLTFSIPINTNMDLTVGAGAHSCPTGITLSVEMFAFNERPIGKAIGVHYLTSTVIYKNIYTIVLEKHDIGTFVPDITPFFPANPFYAVMWPFSSRKFSFSSSTVFMDGKPTACAHLFLVPLLACSSPSNLPGALATSSLANSVSVGMTLKDFILGWISIAMSYVVDKLNAYIGKTAFFLKIKNYDVFGKAADVLVKRIASNKSKAKVAIISNLIESSLPKISGAVSEKVSNTSYNLISKVLPTFFKEKSSLTGVYDNMVSKSLPFAFSTLTKNGLGRISDGGLSLATDNPTISYTVGSPYFSEKVSLSYKDGIGDQLNIGAYQTIEKNKFEATHSISEFYRGEVLK